MKRILKFEIGLDGFTRLPLPPEARFLRAGEQPNKLVRQPGAPGRLCAWFCVPMEGMGNAMPPGDTFEVKPEPQRIIRSIRTGEPFEGHLHYLDTVLMAGGSLEWHLYEVAR
jgi:hypothetical protein